jgi:hypothetical protein
MGKLFSYVSPEALVPADRPLRVFKWLADAALEGYAARLARFMPPREGQSIAPEMLLRALLVQARGGWPNSDSPISGKSA